MNQVYEPLKDPAADGFVDLSQSPTKAAWKATSQSALNEANAAPDATESERKGMSLMMKWSIGLVLGFAVFWAFKVHFTKKHEAHEAVVNGVQTAPVVLPEHEKPLVKKNLKNLTKPKANETTTENVASRHLETPAMPSFEAEKPLIKKPKIKDDFTAAFDRAQITFETNLKKEFP